MTTNGETIREQRTMDSITVNLKRIADALVEGNEIKRKELDQRNELLGVLREIQSTLHYQLR